MLDVIHYFLENDFKISTPEEAEAQTRVRKMIYETFYSREYLYGVSDVKKSFDYENNPNLMNPEGVMGADVPTPFDPTKNNTSSQEEKSTKPKKYVEPTPFDGDSTLPFGKILDSPMN